MRVSVVIAAWNGRTALENCLASLQPGCAAELEVVAVSNFDAGDRDLRRDRFPALLHVRMPDGTPVPQLRAEGIRRSSGEIVALAEDHCTFDASWCAELLKAHHLPHAAIGGAVENASGRRALDWAVYFYDYGKFMLPLGAGPASALSGNNVSYKRRALREVEPAFREGLFEPFLHGELARRGLGLYLTPGMIVYHQKRYRAAAVIRQAYHLARDYGARRVAAGGLPRKALLAAASLALPVLLPARIVCRTVAKRRLVPELLRSLPYLLFLTASWSCGELCGYLAGAGASGAEWK